MYLSKITEHMAGPLYLVLAEGPNTPDAVVIFATTDKAEAVATAYRNNGVMVTASDILNLDFRGEQG